MTKLNNTPTTFLVALGAALPLVLASPSWAAAAQTGSAEGAAEAGTSPASDGEKQALPEQTSPEAVLAPAGEPGSSPSAEAPGPVSETEPDRPEPADSSPSTPAVAQAQPAIQVKLAVPAGGSVSSPQSRYRTPGYDGPPSLFGRRVRVGGYGGLSTSYTRMFGQDGALVGGEGALLLNHRLALGVAAYGFSNPGAAPVIDDVSRQLEVGYGGGVVRYSFYGDFPVYITVGALFGGGSIVAAPQRDNWSREDSGEDEPVGREHVDVFGVIQPELTLHANFTRWMRLGLTAGYRVAFGVDRFDAKESDINGLSAGASLQFGAF